MLLWREIIDEVLRIHRARLRYDDVVDGAWRVHRARLESRLAMRLLWSIHGRRIWALVSSSNIVAGKGRFRKGLLVTGSRSRSGIPMEDRM